MSFTSFIGQAQTAIDGKGRSAFPREFRRQLTDADGKEFVVTRGPNHTLRLFLLSEFEKFMLEVDQRSNPQEADILRRRLGSTLVELDGQNRILLPKYLLEYAGLKGEVLYIQSRGKTLEMWNPDRFNEQNNFDSEDNVAAFDDAFYGKGSLGGSSAP